jgi:flagellar protein FlaJ
MASTLSAAFIAVLGVLSILLFSQRIGGLTLLSAVLVSILPPAAFQFLKNRKLRKMESEFPDFLADLAESKQGGMTLLDAFQSASNNDYGPLNTQIDRIHRELSWGIPFPEVLQRFSKRMSESTVIQESISIIIQSYKSGGDIGETISSVSDDSAKLRDLAKNKDAKLQQQLFIMYLIFFLFIGIVMGIYTMLSELLGLGTTEGGAITGLSDVVGSESGGPTNFCNGNIAAAQPLCTTSKLFGFLPSNITAGEVSLSSEYASNYGYGRMAYYKALLFVVVMVQGILNSLLAGQIREGSLSAGVKHAVIMLPIGIIVYISVVGNAGI